MSLKVASRARSYFFTVNTRRFSAWLFVRKVASLYSERSTVTLERLRDRFEFASLIGATKAFTNRESGTTEGPTSWNRSHCVLCCFMKLIMTPHFHDGKEKFRMSYLIHLPTPYPRPFFPSLSPPPFFPYFLRGGVPTLKINSFCPRPRPSEPRPFFVKATSKLSILKDRWIA